MRIIKAALSTLGFLVVFDIAGAVASFVFEVLPLRGVSGPLFYVLWAVLGFWSGMLSADFNGKILCGPADEDWSNRPEGPRAAATNLVLSAVVVFALFLALQRIVWTGTDEPSDFVPDSLPLTITYFAANIAAAGFAVWSKMNEARGRSTKAKKE